MKIGEILAISGVAVAALLVPVVIAQSDLASASPSRSTLEAYPGFRMVDSELDEAAFAREDRARQNLTKECMAKHGLPYVPTYFVTADFGDLAEFTATDPNEAYAAGLTEAQRLRFNQMLYGMDDPNAVDQPKLGGCLGDAYARVPGVYGYSGELHQELLDARLALSDSPVMATAVREWAACMTAKGFPYPTVEDLYQAADAGDEQARAAVEFDDRYCAASLARARDVARVEVENQFVKAHSGELDRFRSEWEASAKLVARYQ